MGGWQGALEEVVTIDAGFWKGKRVLLTGHTGFKGGWLALRLSSLGAQVAGIALPPATVPSLFALTRLHERVESHFCDIRDAPQLAMLVRALRPEIVFHLAAQPLVRASYRDPLETWSTNIMGTAHVLDALRGLADVRVAVMVTTDKVYQNHEYPYPYREQDALGGYDPYSASKAASELVIDSYRRAYLQAQGISVASARAGNVIGGGDWSTDRLIPDAVRAWQAGEVLDVRRPQAVRPWQHVLEPVSGYMVLAERLWRQPDLAGPYNFGPDPHSAASVRTVIEQARSAFAMACVAYGEGDQGPHEAGWLALETAKARVDLGVRPCWTLEETVRRTMAWYAQQAKGADAAALCMADIAAYDAILAAVCP